MDNIEEWVYDKIIEGINFLSIEKYEDALSCFDIALEHDKNNLAALNNKALSLIGLNKFEQAITIFDEVLWINPFFSFSLCGKGEALFNLGYDDAAILYFDRALDNYPKYFNALLNKAKVFCKYGDFKSALKCLNKIKLFHGSSVIDKKMYESISMKSKITFIYDLQSVRARFNNCINSNEFDKADEVITEALKSHNSSLYLIFNKGFSLYMLNQYDQSLKFIDEVLKIDFMNIGALDFKSRIYIKKKNYKSALECLDNIKKFGGSVDSSLYRDLSLKVKNKFENSKSYILKANELVLHNDLQGALNYYDAALNLDCSSIIALNNKGYVQYLLKDYLGAINTFNLVLNINESNVYSLIGKSYSLYFLNKYADALICFNRAIDIDDSCFNQDYIDLLNKKIKLI